MRIEVLGGGIVGLAIGLEAIRRQHDVRIAGTDQRGAASPAAGGMLAPIAEAEPTLTPLAELGLQSLRMYAAWVAGIEEAAGADVGFLQNGSLIVALDADHRAELERVGDDHRRMGLASRWCDAAEVRRLEPNLHARQLGGLFVEAEASVDPRRLLEAMSTAFEGGGGTFGASVSADVIVDCRGAWIEHVPIRPVKGHAIRLGGGRLLERVVRTPDVYLVPRRDGTLYVGATTEEVGYDAAPRAGAVHELLEFAWRALPATAESSLEEVVVGFRPAARDNLPVLGWTAPGRFVAGGHYRNGILLAPRTAQLALDAIEGADPDPRFEPRRFERRTA